MQSEIPRVQQPGLLQTQKSKGSSPSPEGKGGGADGHREAQGPAGARCSRASCGLELLLLISVNSATAHLWGAWNSLHQAVEAPHLVIQVKETLFPCADAFTDKALTSEKV